MAFSVDEFWYLAVVAEKLLALPRGQRSALIQRIATFVGCSKDCVYRGLKRSVGPPAASGVLIPARAGYP